MAIRHLDREVQPTSRADNSQGFKESLEQLESCLESPIVPGELTTWAAALDQACEVAKSAWESEAKVNHAEQLNKLATKDPDLLNRVTQMRQEDIELRKDFDQFEAMARRMNERADIAEPQERKADAGVQALVDSGLALVIRIRKQERALATWFSESFQRDIGGGD